MDILSFHRAVLVLDKLDKDDDEKNVYCDFEAELIGDAVSAQQRNARKESYSKKRKLFPDSVVCDNSIVGIRVRGYHFYFYRIPFSQPLLDGVLREVAASEVTIVQRCCNSHGYDFRVPEDRKVIIEALDALRCNFKLNEWIILKWQKVVKKRKKKKSKLEGRV